MAGAGNDARLQHDRVSGGPTPPLPDLEIGLLAAPKRALLAKRILDIVLSLLALLLLLPALIVIVLAVRLTSPGPVFFVQDRVGRGGQIFRMLKFRSMHADAEARRAEFAALNEATGPVFKMRQDPRITPVGRLLRKLSLDELPQLINVVRGDMSLVGPRPPLPEEVETYDAVQLRRLLAMPGLTCIWQVSGRSNVDFAEWIEMDLQYIRSWTLGLDIALLLRTIPAVFTGRGAY